MSYTEHHVGGLVAAPDVTCSASLIEPLRDGSDVSWLSQCKVGDNQGRDGACAIFSMANWAEIVHSTRISDKACLDVYRDTLREHGRTRGGLSFSEAFRAAKKMGWLPGAKSLRRVYNLQELINQPLIAGYRITNAWDFVSKYGYLDHTADNSVDCGYHAVVIAAHGSINQLSGGPWVYFENSWGLNWGWKGIGVVSEDLHKKLCREMWVIE